MSGCVIGRMVDRKIWLFSQILSIKNLILSSNFRDQVSDLFKENNKKIIFKGYLLGFGLTEFKI